MAERLCPGCGKPIVNRPLERVSTLMMDYSGRIWHKACAQQVLAKSQELEAQAAAQREALAEIVATNPQTEDWLEDWEIEKAFYRTQEIASKALSSSAGQDLLERVKKLETVAEAARKLLDKLPPHPMPIADLGNAALELEEALAALEGGEQDA